MVGKVWSDLEERYFWRTAVAQSSKRVGIDRANPEKTWDQLASEMHRAMERQGGVRETLTETDLVEHYFQNIEGERRSPNATAYVNEYLAKLGPNREILNLRTKRPRRRISKEGNSNASRRPLPTTAPSATRPRQNEDVVPSVEATARQEPRSTRPAARASSRHSTRASSRGSSRPSRPLRPLAPAGTQVMPPSRSAGPSHSSLSYANHQDISFGWRAAPPTSFPSSSSSLQYHTPVTSRPANGDLAEDFLWGYQTGKRSAPGPLPSPIYPKSQKTSASGVAGRDLYPEYTRAYDMGDHSIAPSQPISPLAMPQTTTTSRTPSDYSTASTHTLHQGVASGYQMGQHPSPESLASYSSYSTTYASSLSRTASNGSVDESLFVQERDNNRDDVSDGAEASNGTEAQSAGGVRTANHREMGRGAIINWDDGNIGYDSVRDGRYAPGKGGNY
ncbi:hypothetical protein F5Y13DRAFT_187512 [Hypoxylon sp. FL1857]|nr:hypothetical protein F5Y13DRAFT_187512 [Hypoxylon sp. FL1857]